MLGIPIHLRTVIFAILNLRANFFVRVCAHFSKFVAVCFGLLLSSRMLLCAEANP